MVAAPLDQVVEAGLADAEVNPDRLMETIVSGFEWMNRRDSIPGPSRGKIQ
jgi:hypothetical protein